MSIIQNITTVQKVIAGGVVTAATALFGSYKAGEINAKKDDSELTRILREYSRDGRKIGFGEAVQFIDKDKNGHISEGERKRAEELRDKFNAIGSAMIESAQNIDRALKIVEGEN